MKITLVSQSSPHGLMHAKILAAMQDYIPSFPAWTPTIAVDGRPNHDLPECRLGTCNWSALNTQAESPCFEQYPQASPENADNDVNISKDKLIQLYDLIAYIAYSFPFLGCQCVSAAAVWVNLLVSKARDMQSCGALWHLV